MWITYVVSILLMYNYEFRTTFLGIVLKGVLDFRTANKSYLVIATFLYLWGNFKLPGCIRTELMLFASYYIVLMYKYLFWKENTSANQKDAPVPIDKLMLHSMLYLSTFNLIKNMFSCLDNKNFDYIDNLYVKMILLSTTLFNYIVCINHVWTLQSYSWDEFTILNLDLKGNSNSLVLVLSIIWFE